MYFYHSNVLVPLCPCRVSSSRPAPWSLSQFHDLHTSFRGHFNIINILYSGLIISGGNPSDSAGQSVEVYVPSTGQHCQLTDLPERLTKHTMEKMTVCGGLNTGTSCLTLTSDGWEETTSTLLAKR